MSTYITRFADSGSGIPVAVKDLVDMAGVVTTAGCRALADKALPAERDALLLREIRRREAAGEVWIVGKTNLHELAYGTTGANPWWGTSANPRYSSLYPGGSSSGSATAVAAGEAVAALGSDTGGSVRIPAACCGIAGLKTTWGRVPLTGVWPLAPSLDTVGPMAVAVAGVRLRRARARHAAARAGRQHRRRQRRQHRPGAGRGRRQPGGRRRRRPCVGPLRC